MGWKCKNLIKVDLKSYVFVFIIIISTLVVILGMMILNENVTKIGLLELNEFINSDQKDYTIKSLEAFIKEKRNSGKSKTPKGQEKAE